jgi:YD repeat-containing protein
VAVLLILLGVSSVARGAAGTSLDGNWVDGNGTVFNFSGGSGEITENPSGRYCLPIDISVTPSGAVGQYTGSAAFYSLPCNTVVGGPPGKYIGAGSVTIAVAPDGDTAQFTLSPPPGKSCGNCGTTTWTHEGLSTSEQGAAPNPSEMPTTCSRAAPVNCATGTFWHTFTDASVPGLGAPLQFTRTYSSAAAVTNGPAGHGWTDGYNMQLSFDASHNATITQEDGATVSFADHGGQYLAPPWVLATLVANTGGTFTFTREATNVRYVFNASGELVSEADRNGYTTTLAYDGSGDLTQVTDSAGRSLSLAYSGGHLVSMSDPMGHATSYTYDADGDLVSTTDSLGRTWTFTYDPNHLLLGMTDPNGGTTTNAYDGSARVTRQVDPAGRATTWSYSGDPSSASGGTTTITDPSGVHIQEQYSNLELVSITAGAGTPQAATTSYEYDPVTLGRSQITDPNGGVTTNTYDTRGDLLSTTDPLGLITKSTYDANGDRLTATDPLGTTRTYKYSASGNLLSKSTPLAAGGTAKWSYSYGSGAAAGEVLTSTNPDGKTSTYGYDPAGDQTSITDPLGKQTSATYDSDGHLLTKSTGSSLRGKAGSSDRSRLRPFAAVSSLAVQVPGVSLCRGDLVVAPVRVSLFGLILAGSCGPRVCDQLAAPHLRFGTMAVA